VVVCLRVARLLWCYLLADDSFPKSDCYWKGLATPKESRVGKTLMGPTALIQVTRGGIQDNLLKECWMRTTTVAFSTGQAKGGSRDWERVNWVTTLWPDSTTQWTGQWGWVNKMRLSNPIVTFFPTIAALHDYTFIVYVGSCSWGYSLHTFWY
jgi:hypothetical protein